MRRRVVVTGLGAVTPIGNDVATTWRALLDGVSGAAPITKFDAEKFPVRFACEVKGFDPLTAMERKEAKRADPYTQYAVVASVEPCRPLIELQAELERLMQRIGLDPEGRKFVPHVTLARLRDASNHDVADYLSIRGYFPTKVFKASRFVLFSARASTGGGPYVVEDSYALSA